MSRPRLSIARRTERKEPSLATLKKALRLFKSRDVPKSTYRRNAMAWIRAMAQLGDKHTLHRSRPDVRWGVAGEPVTRGIHAPRRFGEQ